MFDVLCIVLYHLKRTNRNFRPRKKENMTFNMSNMSNGVVNVCLEVRVSPVAKPNTY